MKTHFQMVFTNRLEENVKIVFGENSDSTIIERIPFVKTNLVRNFLSDFPNNSCIIKEINGEINPNEALTFDRLEDAVKVQKECAYIVYNHSRRYKFKPDKSFLEFKKCIFRTKERFGLLSEEEMLQHEDYINLMIFIRFFELPKDYIKIEYLEK